jgi:hypothetical protein
VYLPSIKTHENGRHDGDNDSPLHHIAELDDEQQDIAEKLKHIFYGQIEEAKNFLIGIQGLKPTEITAKVNELVGAKIISDRSHKHDLWKVLKDAGLYLPTESNWNQQVD